MIKKIPIESVASREFIVWQCGDHSDGIQLNRLAELCGCFSHFSCHHPASESGSCTARSCPIADIDYPEGLSEEEEDEYGDGFGDEVRMVLILKILSGFGNRGEINKNWRRIVLTAEI